MTTKYLDSSGLTYFWGKLKDYFQPKLVSGTNIKTVNNNSLLGSGNITIQSGESGTSTPTADTTAKFDSNAYMNSTDMTSTQVDDFVDALNVSGGNKETVDATKVGNYYSSGTIKAYKCGGCVTVKLSSLVLSTLSARTTIASLPTGFRPPVEVYSIIHGTSRGILVTSAGNIQIESGTSGTYWASITYSAWN